MEFMDLGSLTDLIQRESFLQESQIGWIAVSVLNAMRYLKEILCVMHRGKVSVFIH
jgi:serine/threonine protein kinase